MNFSDLSWAAVLFYYKSGGDRKYCKIISDRDFIDVLKADPLSIPEKDFEQKVILDYINASSYDLLYKRHISRNILDILAENKGIIANLAGMIILDCNLSDPIITQDIMKVYKELLEVDGLWATGASKILHVLNYDLFAPINQSIIEHFKAYSEDGYVNWLRIVQKNALDVVYDFKEINDSGDELPDFLSRRMRYDIFECHKSIVKFIDEYYWLTVEDKLPVPPPWAPQHKGEESPLLLNG